MLRRGFKTEAEELANSTRKRLALSHNTPLLGSKLLKHLELRISSASKLPRLPSEIKEQLWETDNHSWSAFTISHPTKGTCIFYNSGHSRGRHESDVMHEISHVMCKHQPSKFISFENHDFSLRTCHRDQEEEADWLGGCLKLPRDGLLWALRRNMTNEAIADHFVTTLEMVRFRRNVTGVDKQIQRGRSKR